MLLLNEADPIENEANAEADQDNDASDQLVPTADKADTKANYAAIHAAADQLMHTHADVVASDPIAHGRARTRAASTHSKADADADDYADDDSDQLRRGIEEDHTHANTADYDTDHATVMMMLMLLFQMIRLL